ncbi:YceI family protein [Aliamphritea hakodatensis]|uniref:YceI family protein n=1 Tax=Aliamphritea hakodatensis TaxID=2895352 RepID=UPI0022FDA4B1|nr:YceI family protein [Aliamphritea hakodatensis]
MRRVKQSLLAVMLGISMLASVAAGAAELVRESSEIRFSGTQMGRAFDGQAGVYTATAEFSAEGQLTALQLQIRADSLDTQNAERDQVLHSDEWLDAAVFAEIRFAGQSDDGEFIRGFLTIRDKTLPLDLTVNSATDNSLVSLSAEGEFDRLAFGLGSGEWLDTAVVGATVKFSARLTFEP